MQTPPPIDEVQSFLNRINLSKDTAQSGIALFSQVSVMQTTLISLIFVTADNSSILPFNDRTLVTSTVGKKTFSRSVVRGLPFNNAWVVLLECPSGEAYKGSLHGDKNVGVSWCM